MKNRIMILVAVTLGCLVPACVSNRLPDPDAEGVRVTDHNEFYGLSNDSDNSPWLSPKYDKGIYASPADTTPFQENSMSYSNLKPRIQKSSKKSRK